MHRDKSSINQMNKNDMFESSWNQCCTESFSFVSDVKFEQVQCNVLRF